MVHLTAKEKLALNIFEAFCISIFSIEYILRIYIAHKKLKYIFSFYGLIDLFSILPFYLGSIVDLRGLRIFRVFRVFRAFVPFLTLPYSTSRSRRYPSRTYQSLYQALIKTDYLQKQ